MQLYLIEDRLSFLPIRIRSINIPGTISFIKNKWQKYTPAKPFEYYFLDEDFNRLYQAEQKTGEIFTAFSVLALLIACLGLLGLTAFTVERRIKEIGVRKVLGVSVPSIILMLSKEFIKWIIIANFIAWPIAYYLMNKWLQNFAYRIGISWWVFLMAGGIALLIALATVSFQAIKAAICEPG